MNDFFVEIGVDLRNVVHFNAVLLRVVNGAVGLDGSVFIPENGNGADDDEQNAGKSAFESISDFFPVGSLCGSLIRYDDMFIINVFFS